MLLDGGVDLRSGECVDRSWVLIEPGDIVATLDGF